MTGLPSLDELKRMDDTVDALETGTEDVTRHHHSGSRESGIGLLSLLGPLALAGIPLAGLAGGVALPSLVNLLSNPTASVSGRGLELERLDRVLGDLDLDRRRHGGHHGGYSYGGYQPYYGGNGGYGGYGGYYQGGYQQPSPSVLQQAAPFLAAGGAAGLAGLLGLGAVNQPASATITSPGGTTTAVRNQTTTA